MFLTKEYFSDPDQGGFVPKPKEWRLLHQAIGVFFIMTITHG